MPFGLLSPFRFFSLSEQAVDCDMTIMPEQLLLQHRDDDREKMVHYHDCTRLVHCLFRCGAGRAACLLTVRAPLVEEINRSGEQLNMPLGIEAAQFFG